MIQIRSKGLCPACRNKELEKVPKRKTNLPKESGLTMFFNRHLEVLRKYGRSLTGKTITEPTRTNVCHLFPKRKYLSVATDDRNVVYLTWPEHTRLDYLLDTMDIAGVEREFGAAGVIILGRMAALLPEVKEDGKLKREIRKWKEELTERGNS